MELLNQGGPLFMYTLLVILLLILFKLIKEFVQKNNIKKTKKLVSSLGLFAIAWGFLGQIIGFIQALESIEYAGDISRTVLAGGLRISFLAPAFGMIIFLIARLGIIILTLLQKD